LLFFLLLLFISFLFSLKSNDIHLGLSNPSIWYEIHMLSEDVSLELAGATIPGLPLFTVGRNKNLAWGYFVPFSFFGCK
jgi:acyl-homoserine lactone acylase PvdQ